MFEAETQKRRGFIFPVSQFPPKPGHQVDALRTRGNGASQVIAEPAGDPLRELDRQSHFAPSTSVLRKPRKGLAIPQRQRPISVSGVGQPTYFCDRDLTQSGDGRLIGLMA